MSTKSTMTHGPRFHLYHEALQDDTVYFDVPREWVIKADRDDELTIRIPVEVWEVIRRHPGIHLSLAGRSDKEIRELLENAVDDYRAQAENDHRLAFIGSGLTFGDPDAPRGHLVGNALPLIMRRRDLENRVLDAVEQAGGSIEVEPKDRLDWMI